MRSPVMASPNSQDSLSFAHSFLDMLVQGTGPVFVETKLEPGTSLKNDIRPNDLNETT
jgi:hypothetical protein